MKYNYQVGAIHGLQKVTDIYKDGCIMAETVCVKCGRTKKMRARQLMDERYLSCTCRMSTAFGMCDSKLYHTYHNMKYRCYTKTSQGYSNYGGRGIRICDEWLGKTGFCKFMEWAKSSGYSEGLSIDRIDVNGNYCPDNCRWITVSENTRASNIDNRIQRRRSDRGKYYCIRSNGAYEEFENANEFSRNNSLNPGRVRRAARYNRLYNGMKFGYVCDLCDKPQSTIESHHHGE